MGKMDKIKEVVDGIKFFRPHISFDNRTVAKVDRMIFLLDSLRPYIKSKRDELLIELGEIFVRYDKEHPETRHMVDRFRVYPENTTVEHYIQQIKEEQS